MRFTSILLAAALLGSTGCAKPPVSATAELTQDLLQSPPRLPSPRAGTYTRLSSRPNDPVIAGLVEGLNWDASLSGAAAGLALNAAANKGGLMGWEVREAAWSAGYPYPVSLVRGWSTAQGAPPPPDLVEWLGTLDASVDLGLVRARGPRGDAWVALLATPRVSVGLQPRAANLGDVLTLPPIPGADYAVVDAAGRVYQGRLDAEAPFTLDLRGEWLVQVADNRGVAAKFPVYVSLVPPAEPLLEPSDAPLSDDALARDVEQVLGELREVYGQVPWKRDPMLQVAARAALGGDRTPGSEVGRKLGFDPDHTWRIECKAVTVQDCLDRVLWSPEQRPALLSDAAYWGLAVRRGQPGVHIVALVAAESP